MDLQRQLRFSCGSDQLLQLSEGRLTRSLAVAGFWLRSDGVGSELGDSPTRAAFFASRPAPLC